MGLEDFSPEIESGEGLGAGVETIKEQSEKIKKTSNNSQFKIQKTKKDEKKARKNDLLLAGILVKIIVDKKYDFILDKLFRCIHEGFSSNFILGIISLININISNKIREFSKKKLVSFNYKSVSQINFDDNNLAPEIQKRINEWIEDIIDGISIDYSNIQTYNLILLLQTNPKIINDYISNIFIFFLGESNILIKDNQAIDISNFIIKEILSVLKKLNLEEI